MKCVCVSGVAPAVVGVASPAEHLCVVFYGITELLRRLHEQPRLTLSFLFMRLRGEQTTQAQYKKKYHKKLEKLR